MPRNKTIPVPDPHDLSQPTFGHDLPKIKPEDVISTTGRFGLFGGETLNQMDIVSPWDGALEKNSDGYTRLIERTLVQRDRIREDYRDKKQKAAHDELDEKMFPQFADIAKADLSLVRRSMTDFKRLFGSSGFSMETANERRIHRAGLLQTRWQQLGNDKAAHFARRDLFLACCLEGDGDALYSVLDLPTLEKRILFDKADVSTGIKLFRQSEHPKEAAAVRWAVTFLHFSKLNTIQAMEKARFAPSRVTGWHDSDDGGKGYKSLMADANGYLTELPDSARTLDLAMTLHRVRPTFDMPQEPEKLAETAA